MFSTKIYMQETSKTFFTSKNKKITKKNNRYKSLQLSVYSLLCSYLILKAVGFTMLKKIFYFFITIFFLIGNIWTISFFMFEIEPPLSNTRQQ